MKTTLSASLLFMILFWQACNKQDPDLAAPSLLLSSGTTPYGPDSICGGLQPEVFSVASGESITLEIYVVDDRELSQLKIDVHDNYDCHGHTNKADDWYLQEIIDLSGNEERINKVVGVPANVKAGAYHLGIQAVDAAGNEAEEKVFDVKVVNTNDEVSPTIKLTAPLEKELTVSQGNVVDIDALITDNRSLGDGGKWVVRYHDLATGKHLKVYEKTFPETAGTSVEVSYALTIPNSWAKGDFEISVTAYDGVNNASKSEEFLLHIE